MSGLKRKRHDGPFGRRAVWILSTLRVADTTSPHGAVVLVPDDGAVDDPRLLNWAMPMICGRTSPSSRADVRILCHDRPVRSMGSRGWSTSFTGVNMLLVHALAVRMTADLTVSDDWIPEPLIPEPPAMRIPPSRTVRTAAAQQWAAWWRILWAQNIAHHRETPVQPEAPLLGLNQMYSLDPPKFPALTPTPELRQIVASSYQALSTWTQQISDSEEWDNDTWQQGLIARAEKKVGRPIADVDVLVEVLPVVGTRHWLLTEDPNRHFLHVIVTPSVAANLGRHDNWLLDALKRIG